MFDRHNGHNQKNHLDRSGQPEKWPDCQDLTSLYQTPRRLHIALILLFIVLLSGGLWLAMTRVSLVVSAPGRIRPADQIETLCAPDGTRSHNRVAEVLVREGDLVERGERLLRFEKQELENDRASLENKINAMQRELVQLEHITELATRRMEIARRKARLEATELERTFERRDDSQRESSLRLARIELEEATEEEKRLGRLFGEGIISSAEIERARARTARAREELHAATLPPVRTRLDILDQNLELMEKDNALEEEERRTRIALGRAALGAARLELANLELELERAELMAPFTGVITSRTIQVGEIFARGAPVLSIAPAGKLRMEIAVANTDIAHLREGMNAKITLDALDPQKHGKLTGTISFVAPDSISTLDQPWGAPPTYRVCLELTGVTHPGSDLLSRIKLGMSGRVDIITERETLLAILGRGAGRLVRVD